MEIVEVQWLDAGLENVQLDIEGVRLLKAMPRSNVGYLLQKDRKLLKIGFGIITDIEHGKAVFDQILVIPMPMVTSVGRL